MKELLKKPWLNGWPLFCAIVGPTSLYLGYLTTQAATDTGPGVSSMISISVRCAVPWLLLTFVASSIQVLRPGATSLWLLRNRKYFGLAFAAVMGWQLLFILWLTIGHKEYYFSEVFVLRDMMEGILGYSFLIAMTVTSFMVARRHMRPKHWKWLHKIGIYSLWIYVFSVYWWNLSYYDDPRVIDFVYYIAALGTWGLRVAAWGKKRGQKRSRQAGQAVANPAMMAVGAALVVLGYLAASTGFIWQPGAEALLLDYSFTRMPERYFPYWPFEPFLPLIPILLGTAIYVDGRFSRPAPVPLSPGQG